MFTLYFHPIFLVSRKIASKRRFQWSATKYDWIENKTTLELSTDTFLIWRPGYEFAIDLKDNEK